MAPDNSSHRKHLSESALGLVGHIAWLRQTSFCMDVIWRFILICIFYQEQGFVLVGKLHKHPVGHEPTASPSTLLQREGIPFELKLIGIKSKDISCIIYQ
jgi:hypothetical protein